MIAFINCRDRVTCLRTLIAWCERQPQLRIVLIDNASTYAPLLEFYRTTSHEVVRLPVNAGHTALWSAGVLHRYVAANERYIYSDPDVVPDGSCPADCIQHLSRLLDKYPHLGKIGLGLRIDDLPDRYCFKREVVRWEGRFWQRQIEPGLYDSSIDTTFALYDAAVREYRGDHGARTGPPYVARHLPWYLDSQKLDEEEIYYRVHARRDITSWNRDDFPEKLR